jgi:hypothetical protein
MRKQTRKPQLQTGLRLNNTVHSCYASLERGTGSIKMLLKIFLPCPSGHTLNENEYKYGNISARNDDQTLTQRYNICVT